ncbi:hypothetical protein OG586_32885 [Streptomyces murinus]|nr:hypothetical protein [Streptomyces murinus]WUD10701.1 hypothetical protein OG586_32885 [Streptomyces murinus]
MRIARQWIAAAKAASAAPVDSAARASASVVRRWSTVTSAGY